MKASQLSCLLICLLWFVTGRAAELPEKFFELAVTRGAAPAKPRLLRVEKDDLVRLQVASEIAGEVHLHGYRLEVKLAAGVPQELAFKARATGRYRIEWHPAGAAPAKDDHHGLPLAILEVRPK